MISDSLLQAQSRNMRATITDKWNKFKDMGIGKSLLATAATHINSVSVGMCQGYSAILLPQLQDSQSTFHISSTESSWLASLGVITNPVGAILSGVLMEWLGRKRTVQLVSLPFLIGWIMIALSPNMITLCIGRAITGMAIGMGAVCYVYVAEISLPQHRGFLSAFGPIFVSLGVLLVYSFGYLLRWQIASAACAGFALLSGVLITFIPESPTWLMSKGKEKKARKAIVWFRGDNEQAEAELANLSDEMKCQPSSANCCNKFFEPSVWKPFLILVTFFIFQEGSGLYVILYYAVNFFQESGSTIDKYVLSIIVAMVRLVMSIVGTICIKNFNRRTMAIVSGFGMAVSMGVAGCYEYLYSSIDVAERPAPWVPQLCIVANVCASMLGMLQLPWVMIGELFPTSVRGIMGGIVSSLAYLFIFAIVKVYPTFISAFDLYIMMWIFAGVSLAVIAYVLAFLPETQGKTLLQIEMQFEGYKTKNIECETSA